MDILYLVLSAITLLLILIYNMLISKIFVSAFLLISMIIIKVSALIIIPSNFVWILALSLTFFSEGLWHAKLMSFAIMKRRLDIPNALWQSQTYSFLDQSNEPAHNYFEFHSSYYTSDGYFPQSFKAMPDIEGYSMVRRKETTDDIVKFFTKKPLPDQPEETSRKFRPPHFFS